MSRLPNCGCIQPCELQDAEHCAFDKGLQTLECNCPSHSVVSDEDRDLSRGRFNPQSAAMHRKILPYKATLRNRCLIFIANQPNGATLKEICRDMGKLPHSISGRLTELKAAGKIRPTEYIRDDCTVYVAL